MVKFYVTKEMVELPTGQQLSLFCQCLQKVIDQEKLAIQIVATADKKINKIEVPKSVWQQAYRKFLE